MKYPKGMYKMKEFKPDLVSALRDNVREKQEAIDRLLLENRELTDLLEAVMVEYGRYRSLLEKAGEEEEEVNHV